MKYPALQRVWVLLLTLTIPIEVTLCVLAAF